ncbi:MAG: tryptophan-rich sensory protein [Candidatus Bathyarchaeota archaeon]|nr:tryptophan-rich sensory protein [Candidatus Bathyarchaeota archaeon]
MAVSLKRIISLSNVIATVLTIIINSLSNTSILGANTVGEISDAYPTFFTPAGYVFAIWGIIYALLLVFSIHQVLPKQQDAPFREKIGLYYILCSVANIIWIVLWVNNYILFSTILMFLLLASLIVIYRRLDSIGAQMSLRENLAVFLPFSVYLGWITVASIGNVAVTLVSLNGNGWGLSELSWTILMIGVAIAVTLIMIVRKRDIGFSLVLIWALLGILVKQSDVQNIVLTTGSGIGLIVIALIVQAVRSLRQEK